MSRVRVIVGRGEAEVDNNVVRGLYYFSAWRRWKR